ncbi:hypothetical protein ISCGN_019438 [Ixodes scapularis]
MAADGVQASFVGVSFLAWNVYRLLTRCHHRVADVWRDHAASREHVGDPGAITLLELQQRVPCLEDRGTQFPESTHQPDPGFLGDDSASVTLPPLAGVPASRENDAGSTQQSEPVFPDGHPATLTPQPSAGAPTCLEDDADGRPAGQRSQIAEPAPQACYNLRKTYSAALCSQQD